MQLEYSREAKPCYPVAFVGRPLHFQMTIMRHQDGPCTAGALYVHMQLKGKVERHTDL